MSDRISECLRLRQWVIPLLTRSIEPNEWAESAPRVSRDAWILFFAAETFAWPLARRLGDSVSLLPADAQTALTNAARLEMQRIMAARAQLDALDHVAALCYVQPIVLKGGVALADGSHGFDLGDLDLMLAPHEVEVFGRALVEHGGYHYNVRKGHYYADGALPIELQDKLEVGHGVKQLSELHTQRLSKYDRLCRLSPMGHVLYMIQHSTTKHALRRGHLRDVLLIGSALDACSTWELSAVESAVHESPMAHVYVPMLEFARATRVGDAPSGVLVDVFRPIAASKYATSVWFPRGSPPLFPLLLDQIPHFVASSSDGWRLAIGYLTTGNPERSHWYWPPLARVSALLARAVGMVIRTPYRMLALAMAAIVGTYIRLFYYLVLPAASGK
ncbi:MAG: hypothetical protein ABJE10_24310 [bacterium]